MIIGDLANIYLGIETTCEAIAIVVAGVQLTY